MIQNTEGGWFIGDGETVAPSTKIPSSSTLGDNVKLGKGCTVGAYTTVGTGLFAAPRCVFGDACTIGAGYNLREGCRVGPGTSLAGRVVTQTTEYPVGKVGRK